MAANFQNFLPQQQHQQLQNPMLAQHHTPQAPMFLQPQQHQPLLQQQQHAQQTQLLQQAQHLHALQQVQQAVVTLTQAVAQDPSGGTPEMLQQLAAYQQYYVQLQLVMQQAAQQTAQQQHMQAPPIGVQPVQVPSVVSQPRPQGGVLILPSGHQSPLSAPVAPPTAPSISSNGSAGSFFSFSAPIGSIKRDQPPSQTGLLDAAQGQFFSFDAPLESLSKQEDSMGGAQRPVEVRHSVAPKPLGGVTVLSDHAILGADAEKKPKSSNWVTVDRRRQSRSRSPGGRRRHNSSSSSRSASRSPASRQHATTGGASARPADGAPAGSVVASSALGGVAGGVRVAFKSADAASPPVRTERSEKKKPTDAPLKGMSIMEQFEEQRQKAARNLEQSGQKALSAKEFLEQAKGAQTSPEDPSASKGREDDGSAKAAAEIKAGLPKELQHLEQMLQNQGRGTAGPCARSFGGKGVAPPRPTSAPGWAAIPSQAEVRERQGHRIGDEQEYGQSWAVGGEAGGAGSWSGDDWSGDPWSSCGGSNPWSAGYGLPKGATHRPSSAGGCAGWGHAPPGGKCSNPKGAAWSEAQCKGGCGSWHR